MNRAILGVVLGAALLMGVTAKADDDDRWGDRRGRYGYDDRYERGPGNASRLIGRVLGHLDRVQGRSYDRRDHRQFDHARNDLLRFQDNLARGRFDRGRLDSAIGNIDRVARSRDIHPTDRDRLYRDLEDLRQFRASAQNSNGYGYRRW